MRRLLIATVLCISLQAEEPKSDSVIESLRAENEMLRAQLSQLEIEFRHQMSMCRSLDVMQARVATTLAAQKAEAAKKKAEPEVKK